MFLLLFYDEELTKVVLKSERFTISEEDTPEMYRSVLYVII